jgi:hypothetical protein
MLPKLSLLLCLNTVYLGEPLEGAVEFVVGPGFFGSYPGFALELLDGHEEVQQGGQMSIDGGQELPAHEAEIFLDGFKRGDDL